MINQVKKWVYLVVLSLIWGTSFILIKRGLVGFTPVQLGAIRIIIASLVIFSFGFKRLKEVQKKDVKWISSGAFLGTFFPPFLFALAQTQLDSGITSVFNTLTPLNTTIVGVLAFGAMINKRQLLGVVIGLLGSIALILAGETLDPDKSYWYAIFVYMSSLGYSFNINIIKKHLAHLSPLAITTASFAVVFLPAFIVLVWSGFFDLMVGANPPIASLGYIFLLAVIGTAFAKLYFNKLIQVSSPVFSASVTYTIPVVAIFWGLWDGEQLQAVQLLGALVVLVGVYLSNKKTPTD